MSDTNKIPCPTCGKTFGDTNALGQHTRATHNQPGWVAAQAAKKVHRAAPICPRCGGNPTFSTGKFGTKAECCGLWSWNLKPLVPRETHAARIQAHDVFDRLWKGGVLARGECYRRLQAAMGMSKDECHIAQMSERQAQQVVEIVRSGRLLELADA
jgi:ribosomal protein S27AE